MESSHDVPTDQFRSAPTRACLSAVAFAAQPLTIAGITDIVRTEHDVESDFRVLSDSTVRDVLRRLRLDHYLVVDPQSETYRLSFSVLRGGRPRIWIMLAGCVNVPPLDELVPLFVRLLDDLTPYYRARMDELAPAKAKVISALRFGREGGAMRAAP